MKDAMAVVEENFPAEGTEQDRKEEFMKGWEAGGYAIDGGLARETAQDEELEEVEGGG